MKKTHRWFMEKKLLQRNKFAKSILYFRNASLQRKWCSIGQYVMLCQPIRRSFAPEWQQKAEQQKRARRAKELQIEHYNRTAHPLQPFKIGDHVIVQHPISKQ
jgi:hypothetical protein